MCWMRHLIESQLLQASKMEEQAGFHIGQHVYKDSFSTDSKLASCDSVKIIAQYLSYKKFKVHHFFKRFGPF
jgi:hypothetical protein